MHPPRDENQSAELASKAITYAERQAAQTSSFKLRPDSFPGYDLIGEVRRGGQGVVYQAIQRSTNRNVAIKMLRERASSRLSERNRFDQECAVLAKLNHPNIVRLYDGGIHEDRPYLVMDFIIGRPLNEYVSTRLPSTREVISLFVQICVAVHAAHVRGVVHRDLKPSNILVDEHGEPHILDFGLAKLTSPEDFDFTRIHDLTFSGEILGTLRWFTPEQAAGGADDADIRNDVYALGLLLFHSLTGGGFPYPTDCPLPELLKHIQHTEPDRASAHSAGIGSELDAIVLQCLRKERERRYQSAGEIADDLRRYLMGRAVHARADSAWYVFTKAVKRHRVAALVTAVFLITGLWYGLSMTVMYRRSTIAEQRATESGAAARTMLNTTSDAMAYLGSVGRRLRVIAGTSHVQQDILRNLESYLIEIESVATNDPQLRLITARVMDQLADLADESGDTGAAFGFVSEALSVRTSLQTNDLLPADGWADLSINLVRAGDLEEKRGNHALCMANYLEALSIDQQLARQFPDNTRYLDNLCWSYERNAHQAVQNGDLEEAARLANLRHQAALRLVQLEPENALRLWNLLSSYRMLSMVDEATGDCGACGAYSGRVVELATQLVRLEPFNRDYKVQLGTALLDTSSAARERNDFDEALRNSRSGVEIANELILLDSKARLHRALLADSRYQMAMALAALGRSEEAFHQMLTCCDIQGMLADDYLDELQVQSNYATRLQTVAALARRIGQLDASRAYAMHAAKVWHNIVSLSTANTYQFIGAADFFSNCEEFVSCDTGFALECAQVAADRLNRSAFSLRSLLLALLANGLDDAAEEVRAEALAQIPEDSALWCRLIEAPAR